MSSSTTNQWKLGLFVLSAFALLITVTVWFGARRFKSDILIAYTYFDEAVTGLEIGSPVRFRGMTIGSVKEIRVAPGRKFLEISSAIDIAKLEQIGLREPGEVAREGANIPDTLRAQIERSFVTGVAFLQTDFFDPVRHPPPDYPFPVPANTVHSVQSTQKSMQKGLEALLYSLPTLLADAKSLLARLDTGLGEFDIPALGRELRETLDALQQALDDIHWSELNADVHATLSELDGTLEEARSLLAETREGRGPLSEILQSARRTIDTLEGEVRRADLAGTTASLRDLVDGYAAIAPEARDLLPTLRRAAESIRRLADQIERDPGSLLRGRAPPGDPRNGR